MWSKQDKNAIQDKLLKHDRFFCIIVDTACASQEDHHFGNVAMATPNSHNVTQSNPQFQQMSLHEPKLKKNPLKGRFQLITSVCDTCVSLGSYGLMWLSQLCTDRNKPSVHSPVLLTRFWTEKKANILVHAVWPPPDCMRDDVWWV